MSTSGVASAALVGRTFAVVEIGGAAVLRTPTAEISFGEDGRVSGCASINRFFGPYEVEGDLVSFGQLGSTMMAGVPAAMEQEHRLLQALVGPLRVQESVPAGRVSLLADGVAVLVLESATITE